MLSHVYLAFSLRLPTFFLYFTGTHLGIACLVEIQIPEPYVLTLFDPPNILAQLRHLFLILVIAVADHILRVILDHKGLPLDYLIEHDLEAIELLYGPPSILKHALPYLSDRRFQYLDQPRGKPQHFSA